MIIKKIFAIGTALVGGVSAATLTVGQEGFAADVNNWPDGENPSFAIDGFGQKYLNFRKFNTGVVVTQASGAQAATSMTLWAANDAPRRDPSSYQILGTNSVITAASPGDTLSTSLFTLVSEGAVNLLGAPGTNENRNPGGTIQALGSETFSVNFANTDTYTSYLVLFPTIKNEGQNSMQISEIQIFDAGNNGIFAAGDSILGVQSSETIPEPGTSLFSLLGASLLAFRRRK